MLPTQSWVGHELNCGFNRVRFVSPVPVGAQVRAVATLVKVRRLGSGDGSGGGGESGERARPSGVETVVAVTVHKRGGSRMDAGNEGEGQGERGGGGGEGGGGDKPVLVAEWVTRQYAKA